MTSDENLILRRIEDLEKRVKLLEKALSSLGLLTAYENEDFRSEWYQGTKGYFRWIVEKILHKKWKNMPSEAIHYLNTLNDDGKKELREQWLEEAKQYIEWLKRKGKT